MIVPSNRHATGATTSPYAPLRIRHRNSDRGDIDYFYDGRSVIDEYDASNNSFLVHYNYADRLLNLTTLSGIQYYHHDGLGSTVNLTDTLGTTQVSYKLDPWGHIRSQSGYSINRNIFTDKEHDLTTGLVYFGARYYDPETARFLTQDSYLGEPGTPPSLHRYMYAYSNPTVYIDLHGYENTSVSDGGDVQGGAETDWYSLFKPTVAQTVIYHEKTESAKMTAEFGDGIVSNENLKRSLNFGERRDTVTGMNINDVIGYEQNHQDQIIRYAIDEVLNPKVEESSVVNTRSAQTESTTKYFVVHSTGGELSKETILGYTGHQGKAHAYIMRSGEQINIVPFDETAWATKQEKYNKALRGSMYHIELNYGEDDSPTDAQYKKLADIYKQLSEKATKVGADLEIVPHKEVDRGFKSGHSDPENFDFNAFYALLKENGVDIDNIKKIAQERYLIPNQADQKSNWPPVLNGPVEKKIRE